MSIRSMKLKLTDYEKLDFMVVGDGGVEPPTFTMST